MAKKSSLGAVLMLAAATIFNGGAKADPAATTMEECAQHIGKTPVFKNTPADQMDATMDAAQGCLARASDLSDDGLEKTAKNAGLNQDTRAIFEIAGSSVLTRRALENVEKARQKLGEGLQDLGKKVQTFMNEGQKP